jgi:hypothetical protein
MNVDKENTFRALKDEPLIARHQWWCRLGVHTWTKYDPPVKIQRGVWLHVEQHRTCVCCGAFDTKLLSKS